MLKSKSDMLKGGRIWISVGFYPFLLFSSIEIIPILGGWVKVGAHCLLALVNRKELEVTSFVSFLKN